jgi:hypothetical protein
VRKYVGVDSSSLQLHVRRIVVDTRKPNSASPYTPGTGTIEIQRHPTFTFSLPAAPGPTEAPEFTVLQLAADSLFTTGLKNYSSISGTSFRTPDSVAEGSWFWRIQRADLAGNVANYSAILNFILDSTVPNLPTQVSPANDVVVRTVPVWLHWTTGSAPSHVTSPEFFYVHVSKRADYSDNTLSGYFYADSLALDTPLIVQGQTYYWRMKSFDSAGFYTAYTSGTQFLFQSYICGDVNNSGGNPDVSDLSALVSYLTTGAPVPPVRQAASLNCDATIDVSDLSILVAFLTGNSSGLCCK